MAAAVKSATWPCFQHKQTCKKSQTLRCMPPQLGPGQDRWRPWQLLVLGPNSNCLPGRGKAVQVFYPERENLFAVYCLVSWNKPGRKFRALIIVVVYDVLVSNFSVLKYMQELQRIKPMTWRETKSYTQLFVWAKWFDMMLSGQPDAEWNVFGGSAGFLRWTIAAQ